MVSEQQIWLTEHIRTRLFENGQKLLEATTLEEENLEPVILLEHQNSKWLLVSIDPRFPDMAYGLCDLGMGFPELGSVELDPLLKQAHKSPTWDNVSKRPILEYAAIAHRHGKIVLDEALTDIDSSPSPV